MTKVVCSWTTIDYRAIVANKSMEHWAIFLNRNEADWLISQRSLSSLWLLCCDTVAKLLEVITAQTYPEYLVTLPLVTEHGYFQAWASHPVELALIEIDQTYKLIRSLAQVLIHHSHQSGCVVDWHSISVCIEGSHLCTSWRTSVDTILCGYGSSVSWDCWNRGITCYSRAKGIRTLAWWSNDEHLLTLCWCISQCCFRLDEDAKLFQHSLHL